MDEYRKAVEYYASNHLDYLFHNKGPEHAKIIFENIFKTAEKHIRIAANNLWNSDVVNTEEYINAIDLFLNKKDAKLDIILTSEPDWKEVKEKENPNFYRFIFNHQAFTDGRVEIRCGNGRSFKLNIKGTTKAVHFCTADGCMYRLEDDIDNRSAICNFKDTKSADVLEKAFDLNFAQLDKVDLNLHLA